MKTSYSSGRNNQTLSEKDYIWDINAPLLAIKHLKVMEKDLSEQLVKKTPDERYKYFIDSAKQTNSVYVMYNPKRGEIALNIDKKDKKFLYLFPDDKSITLFTDANPTMKKYIPHKWDLTFFLDTAIPRLKGENTNAALVFPAPNGWGFNSSFDKIVKDISNPQGEEVDMQVIKKLIDYLDENLKEECKDDYTLTEKFCAEINIKFADIVSWLQDHGGYCDCEVLANVGDDID